jgi:septal ring-binding cell division protein DamX
VGGGVNGLRTYLTTSQTITTTVPSDYQIVNANGIEYRLYSNGSVYDNLNQFVVAGGIEGLRIYLTTVQTTTTTVASDFQIVNANGIEYRLYSNGSVYDNLNQFVVAGGIEGLRIYLTTVQTTTTTVASDFQIVNANGIEYRLYTNGSVYDNLNQFVVSGGVEGLRTYLTTV